LKIKTVKHVDKIAETPCLICGSKELRVFFEMLDVPIHCNVLYSSCDAALNCPKGDIRLAFCPVCTYIVNLAFDPDRVEYTSRYENSLYFSPRFQDYTRSLAKRLIERCKLYDKQVISIGCGKGEFLLMLCELGNNSGVGFDPSYIEQNQHYKVKDRVKFVQDFYSERYKDYQGDLIECSQTLEHIQNPKSFLSMLRNIIGDRLSTYVFFEVPNALQIFRRLFVWDIIYEHCSYFTPFSLSLAFSSSGFRICELGEDFGGQYLCILALPDTQGARSYNYERKTEVNQIANDITTFATKYQNHIQMFAHKLEQIEDKGQHAVIWGAGSKGVTFLNVFKHHTRIEFAVDINPRKQGMFIPGTGQQIMPPEFLKDYQPDVIIVMNPIYKHEIRQFTKKLGLTTKLIDAY
jgi:SAM-dependent methyltransferase